MRRRFWGIARRELKKVGLDGDAPAADIAIAIADIIERNRTVGWQHDRDLQNRIRNAIDDFFFRPGFCRPARSASARMSSTSLQMTCWLRRACEWLTMAESGELVRPLG